MKTLFLRFKAPTPAFWRRVQKVAGGLLAVVVALQTGATEPAWLIERLPFAFTVLTTIVTLAQFTCTDTPTDQPVS
jgi:hypothetical protein